MVAARNYLKIPPPRVVSIEPVSILKPLFGADEGLEENLRSFYEQKYPTFELLLAVNHPTEFGAQVARKLMSEYPNVRAELVITGDSPRPNGKVFSLQKMMARARYDVIVMADSDIRVTPDMTRVLASEMYNPAIGLVTCPYRAIPGESFWSRLEAIGMNTEFLSGVLVARLLSGMDFALGCTLAVRRSALNGIGGLHALENYLAEDFMMGKLIERSGKRVLLSSYVIEHRIGSQRFAANLRHRLRWARSTRRSRPWGDLGEVFTNPVPIALVLLAIEPQSWPLFLGVCLFRAGAAYAAASCVLNDPLTASHSYFIPVQDIFSFLTWVAGFFGKTVEWRGRSLVVLANGMFQTDEPFSTEILREESKI